MKNNSQKMPKARGKQTTVKDVMENVVHSKHTKQTIKDQIRANSRNSLYQVNRSKTLGGMPCDLMGKYALVGHDLYLLDVYHVFIHSTSLESTYYIFVCRYISSQSSSMHF